MTKINIDKNRLYTAPEIAKLMGISHVTVFKRIKKGLIIAYKPGRNYVVKGEDLEEYLYPSKELTEKKKKIIEGIVKLAVKEYGEALRKLGKE